MNIVEKYHNLLGQFKRKHNNEVCYIIAPGTTLHNFKEQEKGIYIGVSSVIIKRDILNNPLFKYYFLGHRWRIPPGNAEEKELIKSLRNDIVKIALVSRDNNLLQEHGFYSNNDINNLLSTINNCIPVDMCCNNIYPDIENKPFINHSVVFPALQFALYCGFSKIYLVGCDCVGFSNPTTVHFTNNNNITDAYKNDKEHHLIDWWKKIYSFKKIYYTNTAIININPIGLKGLMDKDIYV